MLDCHSGTVVDFPCCTIDHSSCVLPPLPRWMRHGLITLACVPPAAFLVVMASRHPHWRFRGLLSVHLRCGPHDLLTPCWGLFKECFSPFVTSCTAPCASGRSASWPGRTFSDGTIVPWQGTHNTHAERQLRPVAVGRHNWLFTGSLRAGQRAAAIMSRPCRILNQQQVGSAAGPSRLIATDNSNPCSSAQSAKNHPSPRRATARSSQRRL